MPKSTLDEASELLPSHRLLYDIRDQVKALTVAIGGNPLVTDNRSPEYPGNSLSGKVQKVGERQDTLEAKLDSLVAQSSQAKVDFNDKLDNVEHNTLSKTTVLEWIWKYKVRIGLVLFIVIVNGPAASHFIADYIKEWTT